MKQQKAWKTISSFSFDTNLLRKYFWMIQTDREKFSNDVQELLIGQKQYLIS